MNDNARDDDLSGEHISVAPLSEELAVEAALATSPKTYARLMRLSEIAKQAETKSAGNEQASAVARDSEWSLGEALALVACFGGSNCAMSVRECAAGEVATDEGEPPMPAGKYAWCSEYPEEGAMYLGQHDPDTEEHDVPGHSTVASPPSSNAGKGEA